MMIMSEMKDMAIQDCQYALSLSETAFKQHYLHWRGSTVVIGTDDYEYAKWIMEIYDKRGTEDCLL
jgi:hypothetical protein